MLNFGDGLANIEVSVVGLFYWIDSIPSVIKIYNEKEIIIIE